MILTPYNMIFNLLLDDLKILITISCNIYDVLKVIVQNSNWSQLVNTASDVTQILSRVLTFRKRFLQ